MKLLEKGQRWSMEVKCTGKGNGGCGCGARLLFKFFIWKNNVCPFN